MFAETDRFCDNLLITQLNFDGKKWKSVHSDTSDDKFEIAPDIDINSQALKEIVSLDPDVYPLYVVALVKATSTSTSSTE